MFQVIDTLGGIHDAYGTFVDEDGYIQFILCDGRGRFYKTDYLPGYYTLYINKED